MPAVAVDLSQLAPSGRNGGAARFVLPLLEGLAGEPGIRLLLLVREGMEREAAAVAGARVVPLGPSRETREPRRLRRALRRLPGPLPRLLPDRASLRRLGARVLFSPLQSAAFHEPGLPHVAIAYDLQELSYPAHFDAAELRRRAAFRADLARCDRVAAISAATRDDLVARAGLRPERLSVVHPAGPAERSPLDGAALRARLAPLGLEPGGYALYPASFWPHKNQARLLRALAREPFARDPSFRLVLCGALDEGRAAVATLAASLGAVPALRLLGHQPEAEMTALLQGARLLVLPSLFEGFGIPVVEAFRLGVPVACSGLPALREVAGEAALLFDPADEAAIGEAVGRLWNGEALRRRLADAGRAAALRFPAGEVVGRYAALLRDAAG